MICCPSPEINFVSIYASELLYVYQLPYFSGKETRKLLTFFSCTGHLLDSNSRVSYSGVRRHAQTHQPESYQVNNQSTPLVSFQCLFYVFV